MTKHEPWFSTWSGRRVRVLAPDPAVVCIEDIAHHLSRQCRWLGAVDCEHFSVAQHSVIVSWHMPEGLELAGLLHDATEAYLQDVITPIKSLMPEYRRMEREWAFAIERALGLPSLSLVDPNFLVKEHDRRCLATEGRDLLLPGAGRDWAMEQAPPYVEEIIPLGARQAEELFLCRYEELTR